MHLKPDMPVSMLTKLLRKEKDYEREYRGGARGGKNLFKWDDLKEMNYKERECYLGHSTKIGYLDKGGVWKQGEWYTNLSEAPRPDKAKLEEVKKRDKERLASILGLGEEPKTSKKVVEPQNSEVSGIFKKIKKSEQSTREHRGLGYRSRFSNK